MSKSQYKYRQAVKNALGHFKLRQNLPLHQHNKLQFNSRAIVVT